MAGSSGVSNLRTSFVNPLPVNGGISLADMQPKPGGALLAQMRAPVPVIPLPVLKQVNKSLQAPPLIQTPMPAPTNGSQSNLGGAEKLVNTLTELNGWSRYTRTPAMTASLYEQLHGHYSNLVNEAGVTINSLTAARSKVTALYGAGLASASESQLALNRLNGEITKVRAIIDTSAGEVALLNYQNAGLSTRTKIKSLDANVKSLYTNINAAQKQIGIELKTVDQAVAQLRTSGGNEVASSDRKLNSSVNKVLTGANKAVESGMRPGAALTRDKNGNVLVPAISNDIPLTEKQRTEIGQFYVPLRGVDRSKIDALNPQVAGQPQINVDGLGSGAQKEKARLAELVKKYGSIEAAAKSMGFQSVKQMENLRSIVKSQNFDPSKLNSNFETARSSATTLTGTLGRISTDSLKNLQPMDMEANLKIIGQEVSKRVSVPQSYRDYAKKVNVDVDALVGEVWMQYGAGKVDGAVNFGLSMKGKGSKLDKGNASRNFATKMLDSTPLTALGNIWGTQVRLERVAINLKQKELAAVNSDTSVMALNNAAKSYGNASLGVGASVDAAYDALKTTQKQINNLERNYGTAKLNQFGEALSADGLKTLEFQYKAAKLNLQRTESSQKIAYSLATDRLKLTKFTGIQASFSDASSKIVEDMGTWNTRQFTNAAKYGVTGVDGRKVYKTPEGIIIPPTVLSLYWKASKSGPNASELKQASTATLAAFRNEFSVSGAHMQKRTAQGMAGMGAFNGNLNAYQTRMPIQRIKQPVTPVTLPSAPTVLSIVRSKDLDSQPAPSNDIPSANDQRIQDSRDQRR